MTRPITLSETMRIALSKDPGAHKYGHGHALVLSGGPGQGGAARLAARAALRVGAGLVTLVAPPAAMAEHAAQLTAIMLRPLPDSYALRGLLRDDRISALCLGPGLGIQRAADMVPAALWGARPTVLDADALTAFAEEPERIFTQIHQDVVLTPHPGEFSRLFPDIAEAALGETPSLSLQAATQTAAERAGCVVLLKGPRTHIATPNGQSAYHDATGDMAAPWLATAGSGDVLAGLIAGLMARGMPPFAAACTATWLHAATARSFGPGLIAEDLPEHLPRLLREIGVT